MKTTNSHLKILWASCFLLVVACGKSGFQTSNQKGFVEIAPGLFAVVEEIAKSSHPTPNRNRNLLDHLTTEGGQIFESVELWIHFQNKRVHWLGNSIPINLRVFEGRLYLISFERLAMKGSVQGHFHYFAQKEGDFIEIDPKAYPGAVAGQNMWFVGRYYMVGEKQRDSVEVAKNLDCSDPAFQTSLTAYLWAHLAIGQDYNISQEKWRIDQFLLENYVRTNHPIKLLHIVLPTTNTISIITNVPQTQNDGK